LDAQIAEATRLGKSGELRRLFAKGIALLSDDPWTEAYEYSRSLVLRSARVALRKRITTPPTPGQRPADPPIVKELGTFDGVPRDLRESPFFFDLDLRDVPDGLYNLGVEVLNGGQAIGLAVLQIALRKNVDELTARLEETAAR